MSCPINATCTIEPRDPGLKKKKKEVMFHSQTVTKELNCHNTGSPDWIKAQYILRKVMLAGGSSLLIDVAIKLPNALSFKVSY